ncbi:MAG: 2-alkenal reductase [Pirellulaceae bacterium]|nr:MAG: 2-alkenal reductase [Pirellulaceae bacterium]
MSQLRSQKSYIFLLLIALAFLLGRYLGQIPTGRLGIQGGEASPRAVTPRGDLDQDEKATIALFRSASPSVVHITSVARVTDIFTLNVLEIPQGTGSGFVWDKQGHIVTNFHVISDAGAAQVTLFDSSTWPARLVGVAPDKDLAVLKIEAPQDVLQPIPVGTSHDLQVGQKVFAIGNPFGLDQSLTTGVISALGREITSMTNRQIKDVIQTDAAINPGNSGGPLLDSAGRLIGVNTSILSPSGAFAGIGFAIPVDTVNWVVPQLIQYGRIIRPTIAITAASDRVMQALGLEGVLVLDVRPGSSAEQAGLQPTRRTRGGRIVLGDRIVAVNGEAVRSPRELLDLLEKYRVGQTVELTIVRGGEQLKVPIQLEADRG